MDDVTPAAIAQPCPQHSAVNRVTRRGGLPPSGKFRHRGVTSVEIAVVAPVLFLVVFGMFELGRLLMVQQALTNAAREGCRTAALATTSSSAAVDAAVRSYLQSVIPDAANVSKVTVSVSPSALNGISPGTTIAVQVDVSSSHVSWLPYNYLGLDVLMLSGRSTQRRE